MLCPKCEHGLVEVGVSHAIANDPMKEKYWCINPQCVYFQKPGSIIDGEFRLEEEKSEKS